MAFSQVNVFESKWTHQKLGDKEYLDKGLDTSTHQTTYRQIYSMLRIPRIYYNK